MSQFQLSNVLGSGGTATVIRAEPLPGSRAAATMPAKEVALKAVSKKSLNRRAQYYLNREIFIHTNVQHHPNIASMYQVFEDSSGIYLALELLRGSDLYSALKKERRGLSETVALLIILQVLDALKYMHSLGYAHRDVKPENLMFSEKPALGKGRIAPVKLIDFGLACARDPASPLKDRTSSEKCGTVRYAAPEIVTETSYLPECCDIWSVGIVLYSIIARRNPYLGKTEKEVLYQIDHSPLSFDGPDWTNVSHLTKTFIRSCLARNAADRPSAHDACEKVGAILQSLSAEKEPTSFHSDAATSPCLQGKDPQENARQTDVSGFSSHVTQDGLSSRKRDDVVQKPDVNSPSNSHSDVVVPTGNFFDGLLRAWFSGGPSNSDKCATASDVHA